MMSINTRLTNFAQQELVLGRNDTERNKINASLDELQRKIQYKISSSVLEFKHFGSYTRNTILPREYDTNSDVDLMVVFNTGNGLKTPGTYRRNLLDIVSSAYPNSISKKDFPVVKLVLNHISFDIVPAYIDQDFLGNRQYYIPGSNDSWMKTKPNDLNGRLQDKNQSYGNNIVRNVIRLCKHWNASSRYPFESYEMEKWIVERFLFHGDNLYTKFLSIMNDMAGNQPGVRQALDWIQHYKGTWLRDGNEQKELEWLRKLLPGLK